MSRAGHNLGVKFSRPKLESLGYKKKGDELFNELKKESFVLILNDGKIEGFMSFIKEYPFYFLSQD